MDSYLSFWDCSKEKGKINCVCSSQSRISSSVGFLAIEKSLLLLHGLARLDF